MDSGPRQLWLFDRSEFRVLPTPEARLLRMASRPPREPTLREKKLDEDEAVMRRLQRWGRDLARRFGLEFLALEPERDGVHEHYGICYKDGLIRIRLRHAVTGRMLKESSLVDTLCHELGHLRHFDHSPRFWNFYRKILREARRLGYYRPGRSRAEPLMVQGSLFHRGIEEIA